MTLSATEVASQRAQIAETLGDPAVAIIQARTLTPDGMGGGSASWANVGTVDCRFKPDPGIEEVRGGALSAVGSGVATFAAQVALEPVNRLAIAGTAYNVLSVEVHSWDLCTRARVEIPDFGGA